MPSATLGKDAPSNLFTIKLALPSAKSRALGKGFAECQAGTRQRIDVRWPKPHAVLIFFNFFAECNTRQRIFFFFQNSLPSAIAPRHSAKPVFIFFNFLCRVPLPRHSAKHFLFFFNFLCRVQWPLHSANLGNCCCYFPSFAECNDHCTRQSHSKKKLFFAFPCKQQCIYIYIRNHNSTQYI